MMNQQRAMYTVFFVLGVFIAYLFQYGVVAYRIHVIHAPLGGFHQQPDSRAIARLGKSAVPAICSEIDRAWEKNPHNPDGLVMESASALGVIGDSLAVPTLIALTDHEDPYVRRVAVTSLRRIKDTRSLPALRRHMQDNNKIVRQEAESAVDEFHK
ncbi:HEAT repeat domain-containing protein [bacterium]|nr:HEAT repeat domain-containing protein [bacterium]